MVAARSRHRACSYSGIRISRVLGHTGADSIVIRRVAVLLSGASIGDDSRLQVHPTEIRREA
jgi:hypothetical protein